MPTWLAVAFGYVLGRSSSPHSQRPTRQTSSLDYVGWVLFTITVTGLSLLWFLFAGGHPFLELAGIFWLLTSWTFAVLGVASVHRSRHL